MIGLNEASSECSWCLRFFLGYIFLLRAIVFLYLWLLVRLHLRKLQDVHIVMDHNHSQETFTNGSRSPTNTINSQEPWTNGAHPTTESDPQEPIINGLRPTTMNGSQSQKSTMSGNSGPVIPQQTPVACLVVVISLPPYGTHLPRVYREQWIPKITIRFNGALRWFTKARYNANPRRNVPRGCRSSSSRCVFLQYEYSGRDEHGSTTVPDPWGCLSLWLKRRASLVNSG